MNQIQNRRQFAKQLGIGLGALPLLMNLKSLGWANANTRKQRLVIIFSPNGVVPNNFWPDEEGEEFQLKSILAPFEPFKKQLLTLHGVGDKVRGDGDNHMRGIGCLLTGNVLFPGNIQGGSDTPAGWATGISVDQELKNFLQAKDETRTRFGSLEFVSRFPIVPTPGPEWFMKVLTSRLLQSMIRIGMFNKLYGHSTDRAYLASILDELQEDIQKVHGLVSKEDRRLLDDHQALVREMEKELQSAQSSVGHAVPEIDLGVQNNNDNIPHLSKMQTDLMITAMLGDFSRVYTMQYTNSVGQAKMRWLGIEEDHHGLSHEPDSNTEAVEKLTKINTWYCEQIAYLAKRLAETPEPGGEGSMLDHTTIVWTNELGKGNSHTLEDIPFVLLGGGLPFKMGRSLKFKGTPHNRLLMAILHGFGHQVNSFGSPDFCGDGPLSLTA